MTEFDSNGYYNEALAALRQKLVGLELAIFVDGGDNSHVFDGVDEETISFVEDGRMLRFKQGIRWIVVPNVAWWTEQ